MSERIRIEFIPAPVTQGINGEGIDQAQLDSLSLGDLDPADCHDALSAPEGSQVEPQPNCGDDLARQCVPGPSTERPRPPARETYAEFDLDIPISREGIQELARAEDFLIFIAKRAARWAWHDRRVASHEDAVNVGEEVAAYAWEYLMARAGDDCLPKTQSEAFQRTLRAARLHVRHRSECSWKFGSSQPKGKSSISAAEDDDDGAPAESASLDFGPDELLDNARMAAQAKVLGLWLEGFAKRERARRRNVRPGSEKVVDAMIHYLMTLADACLLRATGGNRHGAQKEAAELFGVTEDQLTGYFPRFLAEADLYFSQRGLDGKWIADTLQKIIYGGKPRGIGNRARKS